jgi:hypothetical protein
MTLYAALSGTQVIHGSITIPFSGIIVADVVLAEPKDVTGMQTLQLADQSFQCTVIRAINFAGARGVRLLGGAAGWRTQLAPKQYGSWGVSVQMSVVLSDAAAEAKEKIVIATDRTLQGFIRRQQAASFVLNELLGASWWMDPTGIVQTRPRDVTPIASDFIAESVIGASGIWKIATEAVADWQPGRTFNGPTSQGQVSRVEHKVTKGTLRTIVHTIP